MNTVAQTAPAVNLEFVVTTPSRAEMMAILDGYDAEFETWQELQTGDWYARNRATGSVAAYGSFDVLVSALDEAVAVTETAATTPEKQLVSLGFGQYDAWFGGERLGTVGGSCYAEVEVNFNRLINGARGGHQWASQPTEHDQAVIASVLAYGKIKAFAAMMASATGDARAEWAERISAEAARFANTPRWNLADYTGPEIAAEIAALHPPPAPASPIVQAAADLLALVATQRIAASTRGMLASRLEKAIELAEAGQTDFPQYETGKTDHGLHGNRHCGCPDATYRHLHVSPVGLCCKHTLAQYLAEQVAADEARVTDRVILDQIERGPRHELPTIHPADAAEIARDIERETALPVSVDERGSIEDMLGYDEPARQPVYRYRGEAKSIEQQRREARAGLGGALKPDAANMQRSRWQV